MAEVGKWGWRWYNYGSSFCWVSRDQLFEAIWNLDGYMEGRVRLHDWGNTC